MAGHGGASLYSQHSGGRVRKMESSKTKSWGISLVVEHLPSIYKTLGSIPTTAEKLKQKTKQTKSRKIKA
jgi:hypothetical protein